MGCYWSTRDSFIKVCTFWGERRRGSDREGDACLGNWLSLKFHSGAKLWLNSWTIIKYCWLACLAGHGYSLRYLRFTIGFRYIWVGCWSVNTVCCTSPEGLSNGGLFRLVARIQRSSAIDCIRKVWPRGCVSVARVSRCESLSLSIPISTFQQPSFAFLVRTCLSFVRGTQTTYPVWVI